MSDMKRREFITLLGGAAVAWPLAARAQQPAMPVIGLLAAESPDLFVDRLRAFQQGLKEGEYIDGQNVAIEYRWAESHYDRLPALAADLVRRQVAVIATLGSAPAALAAKAATTTIPIVFFTGSDPLRLGLVTSLNRPGGNVTGVTALNVEVGPKRVELLHEVVPSATLMALLVNPTSPDVTEITTKEAQAAARTLGLKLEVLHASTERDLDTVFTSFPQLRAGALVIGPDAFFISQGERLGASALRNRVPAIFQYRPFVAAGGLMSYGGSISEAYRSAGVYTSRVLKGEKPANLPVQQVTKVEFILNLKTANVLGLTIPLPLLGRADEVIE
jgi:putative ABC transport system substrate-binding protein